MKKLTITLIALVAMLATMAQTPNGFNYQTALRDTDGNMLTDQSVAFQISILQGTADGTTVYVETHSATTNAHGLANFEIGGGTSDDDFSAIDWANGPYFIKVELDAAGGTNYVEMGTQQLLSVPYAKYAESSADVAAIIDRITVLEEMNGIGTMTDIDGNEYEMTKIGNQIWMAENLRVTKYADGTPLEHIIDSATWNDDLTDTSRSFAYPYYDEAYAYLYGALYTWYAATNGDSVSTETYMVQGVCPDGWHMPSNEEFEELVEYLTNHGFAGQEAIALKSTSGWEEDGNGTDDFGFNWLPTGVIDRFNGGYAYNGIANYMWTSSNHINTNAYKIVGLVFNLDSVYSGHNYNNNGLSVRCIKD